MGRMRVGILGGGFGGLTLATELLHHLEPGDITLVDRRGDFTMGLAKLGVLVGSRPPSEGRRPLKYLEAKGVEVVQGEISALHPGKRTVTVEGRSRTFDRLVVALGAELRPDAVPGFAEGAINVYTFEGAAEAHRALEVLQRGRVMLLIAGLPFKCPPAPYEAALLVEEYIRRRGVRPPCELALYTPEPQPMPILGQGPGGWLAGLMEERGIQYHPNSKVTSVGPQGRKVEFEGGGSAACDLLMGVPVHRAPGVVQAAGMTDASGWIPVDRLTLETEHSGVYAIGDVAGTRIPKGLLLPRAGILAEEQARVVAERIAAEAGGQRPTATFGARGYCFVEVGGGMAARAEGEFFADPSPRATLEPPSRKGLQEKRRFEEERLQRWFGP